MMREQLKSILVESLFLECSPSDIDDEAPFADYHVDSFMLLEFLAAIEETLGIHFEESDITAENLRSIATLERLVASRQ